MWLFDFLFTPSKPEYNFSFIEKWDNSIQVINWWVKKITWIKIIREINTWLGLKEAKNIIDKGWIIIKDISIKSANEIKKLLTENWIEVEII